MAVRIFFSWQSDVAQDATTRAIRLAVSRAAAAMTAKYGEQVIPDEATREVPGSPYIPATLAEKIRTSDVFVGDITSISVTEKGKSIPNPNVTFELGLAAAHLGWDRIILLFNEDVAAFSNLPFDFDRHRISKYRLQNSKPKLLDGQGAIDKLVAAAVGVILEQKPLRPRELEGKSEAQIKKERDVLNLRWFFRHMSVDMIGIHIRDMPGSLHYFAAVMADGMNEVINNPSFKLYDSALEKNIRALTRDLTNTLAHDRHYRELNNIWVQAFGQRGPYADQEAEQAALMQISKSVRSLARNLDRVLKTIRTNYLDVDLEDLSQKFAREYKNMVAETKRDFG